MNKDVWIKPSGPTFAPSAFVAVICDVRPITNVTLYGGAVSELLSIHCVESHRRFGHWTEPTYRGFDSGNDFFDWLEEFATIRKRLYIISDSASTTLTLTGFWDRVESRGCRLVPRGGRKQSVATDAPDRGTNEKVASERQAVSAASSVESDPTYYFSGLVVGVNADIIKYRTRGKSFVWCSSSQYIQSSEEDIAKAIGYQWVVSPAASTDGATTRRAAGERAFLLCRTMRHLADWWQSIDGGPWGFTTGMLAMSFLRKRIKPRTILNHSQPYAKELEKTAIFGGRRSLWFTGNIGTAETWEKYPNSPKRNDSLPCLIGRIAHVDIRSMYPHILATQLFPVRLLTTRSDRTVSDIEELLRSYGVICRVRVKTQEPMYPHTRNGNTVYPIGEFVTTLCGPELASAISNKHVVHIYSTCTYALDNPFSDAAIQLLKHRMSAIEEKQVVWELFIKHISNAMAGKLAQRKHLWVERPQVSSHQSWGQWIVSHIESGSVQHFRSIAGMVWERISESPQSRPMGAAFAYLTAYGRHMMNTLRYSCPDKTIISQDTDGIWVKESALEHLPIGTEGSEYLPGDLRITAVTDAAYFLSPQHYWYGGLWKLSGFKQPTINCDTMNVTVNERVDTLTVGTAAPIQVSVTRQVTKHLGSMPVGGFINDDGWVSPHYYHWVDPL